MTLESSYRDMRAVENAIWEIVESVSAASKVPFQKRFHQGNYSGAVKHIEKKYGPKVVKHPKVQDALRKANEEIEKFNETMQMGGDNKKKSMPQIKKDMEKAVDKANAKLKEGESYAQKMAKGFEKPKTLNKNVKKKEVNKPGQSYAQKIATNMKEDEMKDKCGEGEYWCNKDQKCKPIPDGHKVDKDGILVKEFKNYNVTHKPSGKKYRVTAMHSKSAADKARAQHGGSASRYSGTSTSDFHVEEIQLDELSPETKKSYIAKAQKKITDHEKFRDYQNKSMDKEPGKFSKSDKAFVNKKMDKDLHKHRVGIKRAASKLRSEETIQEEFIVEKLDAGLKSALDRVKKRINRLPAIKKMAAVDEISGYLLRGSDQ